MKNTNSSRTKTVRKILLGLSIAALASTASAANLVISNWDGYMAPDAMDAFKAATGNTGEVVKHATNEEIMGKLVASGGKGYDVVFVSSPFAEVLNKLGLAETIDASKVPNLANLYPEAAALAYDPGNTFSVPYTWGTTGLCYRSDLVKAEPASWNDLLKPADDIKGKTTMLATDRWLLAAGQLADGFSVNEIDPAKMEQVKNTLIEAKKTLLAYDDTTFYAKLVSGEALMVQAWDGWCNYGITDNKDIKYVIPKEGSRPLGRHDGRDEVVREQGRRLPVHQLHARRQEPRLGRRRTSSTRCRTRQRWTACRPSSATTYPNMAMPVGELTKFEVLRDVGEAQKEYSRIVSEIKAAQ